MDPHEEQIRLLDFDGTLLANPTYKVDLSDDALRQLYRQLVVVRRIDAEGTNLQRQGHLGIWASCKGQEAAQVGSAAALAREDFVFPSYRELGVIYVRGIDPLAVFRMYRGQRFTGWDPQAERTAPYTVPIGTHTLHAVGWALGARWDGTEHAAVCYFGDGATSEGDTSEALNFAAVHAAPVVFFCQNNQWAISVPLAKQVAAPIWRRGAGFGMTGVQVDGNDVLAVYAVTKAALARAHEGGGPTLIEAVTYRMEAHTTTDDPTRYRSRDELDSWDERDPIKRYLAYLRSHGLWSQDLEDDVQNEAEQVVARIREGVVAMADPALHEMVDHVYADPPETLKRQFAALEAFEAEMEGGEG
jgi:2-oxoisovalerate dehydrogenase E1 component alpha subunit